MSVLRETNAARRTYGNPRPLYLHGPNLQADLRETPAQELEAERCLGQHHDDDSSVREKHAAEQRLDENHA